MKTKPTLEDLVTVNLQYAAGTAALNTRAVAQLLAKQLYAAGKMVSKHRSELAKEAAAVLEVKRISREQIDKGLAFLKERRWARDTGNRWLLTDEGFKTVDEDVVRARQRTVGVLRKHFAGRIDPQVLDSWFTDACIALYSLYGSQQAASLARQHSPRPITAPAVSALLESTVAKHGLDGEREGLITSFQAFLSSDDQQDIEHKWSLCQALLAARLVAANLGPDPISVREIRDATVLLDTNVVMVTALEKHRLINALVELAKALKDIGVSLAITGRTRDEYMRVVLHKRAETLRIVGRYSRTLVEQARDPLVATALKRGCTSIADYQSFFDEIAEPPTSVDTVVPITLLDDSQTLELENRGACDAELQETIQQASYTHRRKYKGDKAAEHDACLCTVAEGFRKQGKRCWVLTLDRSMHEHSLSRIAAHELPVWVSLDALIQVLAVDNAGPSADPSNFAPLMSAIIRQQCEPLADTYTTEDLAFLLDTEDRCADLPDEDVRAIAVRVARARLRTRKVTSDEVQLEIRRAFEGRRMAMVSDLQLSDAELRAQRRLSDAHARRADRLAPDAARFRVARIRRGALQIAARDLLLWGVPAAGFAAAAWILTRRFSPKGDISGFVQLLSALAAPAIAIGKLGLGSVPRFWRAWREAPDRVAQEMAIEPLDVI